MPDPYNLGRFLEAQTPIYQEVLSELRHHHKNHPSHHTSKKPNHAITHLSQS